MKIKSNRLLRENGVTLIELIITLAILGMVIPMIFSSYLFGARIFSKGEEQSTLQSNLRMASDYITGELRFSTEIHILSSMPDLIGTDDTYHYIGLKVVNDNMSLVHLTKDGQKRQLYLGDTGHITFNTQLPNKTVRFNLRAALPQQEFEIQSDVYIQNLRSLILGNDGIAIKFLRDSANYQQPLMIDTNTLPIGEMGNSYNHSMISSGGTPNDVNGYDYSISGTLPPGISFIEPSGIFNGAPTTEGSYTVTITVSDSSNPVQTRSRTYKLLVVDPSLSASSVASGITSIQNPDINQILLQLPSVPVGFEIMIMESSDHQVVSLDGIIAPPESDKTVTLVLRVVKLLDMTYADTVSIDVIIPEGTGNGIAHPTTSDVSISGTEKVTGTLQGNYAYFIQEPGLYLRSEYIWYRSDNSSGTGKTQIAEGTNYYTVVSADEDKYIFFEVKVYAKYDEIEIGGIPVMSPPTEKIRPQNSPPEVKYVNINFDSNDTSKIVGSYLVVDFDGDALGTHKYQWFKRHKNKDEIEEIDGAKYATYTYQSNEKNNYYFYFQITPVTTDGLIGTPVMSSHFSVDI